MAMRQLEHSQTTWSSSFCIVIVGKQWWWCQSTLLCRPVRMFVINNKTENRSVFLGPFPESTHGKVGQTGVSSIVQSDITWRCGAIACTAWSVQTRIHAECSFNFSFKIYDQQRGNISLVKNTALCGNMVNALYGSWLTRVQSHVLFSLLLSWVWNGGQGLRSTLFFSILPAVPARVHLRMATMDRVEHMCSAAPSLL